MVGEGLFCMLATRLAADLWAELQAERRELRDVRRAASGTDGSTLD